MPYDVFLSYSQAVDGKLAPQIQALLGSIAKPWYVRRALHVFRDKTSLTTSPGLWSSIEAALGQSRNFVLLASPAAAASPWVAKELEHWLARHGVAGLHIVLTSGRITWDPVSADFNWSETNALPHCLSKAFAEEPLYVDLTWAREVTDVAAFNSRFRPSVATLVGAIRGIPPDEILGEDLRQHRKTLRIAWGVAGIVGVLAISAGAASIVAVLQRDEAVRQEKVSRSQRIAAEALNEADRQRDLAALLAAEALEVTPTAEARRALAQVLSRSHRLVSLVDRVDVTVPAARTCCAAFSPDGRWLAWSRGPSVAGMRLNPDEEPKTWLTAAQERYDRLAFDPANRQLVAARGQHVDFWDPERGKLVRTETLATKGFVTSLRTASIGSELSGLAVGLSDTRLFVSLSKDRDDFRALRGHLGPVAQLAFSSDGRLLASADAGIKARILLWNLAEDSGPHTVIVGDDLFRGIAFTPEGLVIAQSGGRLSLWDVRNPAKPTLRQTQATGSDITALAQSPFKGLATGHADGSVRLWTARGGMQAGLEHVGRDRGGIGQLPGPVRLLEFSASAHLLAAAGGGLARTFDVAGQKAFGPDMSLSRAEHASLALSSNGARLALIDKEGTVATYHTSRGADIRGDVSYFPDGKTFLGPSGRMLLEIDRATGQPTGRPLTGFKLLVNQVATSTDGHWIAASAIGEGTLLWSNRESPRNPVWVDRADKTPTVLHEAMSLLYRGLSFDPANRKLAFARNRISGPGAKNVWTSSVVEYDIDSKASKVLLSDYPALINDIAPSKIESGVWFAVAWDGTMQVIDAGGQRAQAHHIGNRPERLCTLPTGAVVVADDMGQVLFWKASKVLLRSREHLSGIEALACDPQGRWVLTGDQGGSVRIWDANTHQHLGELFQAAAAVTSIAFAPGSDTAVVLTAGGVALQVPVSEHAQRARACELASGLRLVRTGSPDRLNTLCGAPPAMARIDRQAGIAAYEGGLSLLRAERFEAALSAFRKAAKEHPNLAAIEVGMGLALLRLERPAEALVSFDRAERLSQDRAEISLNRALALRLLGDADAARLALERAMQLNPMLADPYVELADMLAAGGRVDEARSVCARLRQAHDLKRREADCLAVVPQPSVRRSER